jgi:N-acetylglucosaminyl-diphospho-decaprenol L-rhamnosyltransferase
MHDLAVIVISTNEAHWLRPCLSTLFDHLDGIDADVIVVDNDSTDDTVEMVEREFTAARVVHSANRGFSHANNRALMACDARYVLFLNPDTEIVEGEFAELVAWLDEHPEVGLVGVRQLLADGTVYPSVRYFPNALRAFGEALGSERLPGPRRWLGERELDLSRYDREFACDWTLGSFMLTRREAIEAAGFFDERFFMTSEETDFCYRIRHAGWEIRHLPQMTIIHHIGKAGIVLSMEAQNSWTRLHYARKHFSAPHRAVHYAALVTKHLVRSLFVSRDREVARTRRRAARYTLRVLIGAEPPPFGSDPATAVASRPPEDSAARSLLTSSRRT